MFTTLLVPGPWNYQEMRVDSPQGLTHSRPQSPTLFLAGGAFAR